MSETVKKAKLPKEKTRIPLRSRITKGKVKSFLAKLLLYVLLIEIAFIIIFPLLTKLSSSFMSQEDMYDRSVIFIPRAPTMENYATVWSANLGADYLMSMMRTLVVSIITAVFQTMVCSLTGYGLAKLKSKWASLVFAVVILTIIVPPQVIIIPMYLKFRYFDIFGLFKLIGIKQYNMIGSLIPTIILSITGYGFKNGLYIFIMRQFYKGIPEEIEEAAAIDGYGTLGTYFRIVLPMAIPMMITIFMFAFSWAWTDTFYANIFFSSRFKVLAIAVFSMPVLSQVGGLAEYNGTLILNTAVLMAIVPLILIYIFAQRWIIAGIERSGLVG